MQVCRQQTGETAGLLLKVADMLSSKPDYADSAAAGSLRDSMSSSLRQLFVDAAKPGRTAGARFSMDDRC